MTSDCVDIGELARSTFAAGTRVSVEQLGLVLDRIGTHCMGFGELLAAPLPGGPLELRIRGVRGLASTRIREARAPVPGYLLLATERSVYLVALPELQNAELPQAVESEAIGMLKGLASDVVEGAGFTQYVRLSVDEESEHAALACGPVFASALRDDDGSGAEALGQCELLSAVVPGSPLRLATAHGRVIATSDIVSVTQSEAGEFCVATGNSLYVLAPILPASGAS